MNIEQRFVTLLNRFVEEGPAGCSLTVVKDGKTLVETYVGHADLETKKPIQADTLYRIYSMTKVITCTAALILYERGLFMLNDPLEKYLPEFANPQVYRTNDRGVVTVSPATRSITIKDLFTMTSGITYTWGETRTEKEVHQALVACMREGHLDNKMLSAIIARTPLKYDPGTTWNYGLNHDVLGDLIERLSGKTLGQFFYDDIFQPLGMHNTTFHVPESETHRIATLYNRSDDGRLTPHQSDDETVKLFTFYESGGAGLYSTLGDYSIFAQMLANGGTYKGVRILGRKTVELMQTNHLKPDQFENYTQPFLRGCGYGLGVRTMLDRADAGCNGSFGEFGWMGAAGTIVFIDPAENLSATFMMQMFPNFEEIHGPLLRATIYGVI